MSKRVSRKELLKRWKEAYMCMSAVADTPGEEASQQFDIMAADITEYVEQVCAKFERLDHWTYTAIVAYMTMDLSAYALFESALQQQSENGGN